jgi:hypothetical protein
VTHLLAQLWVSAMAVYGSFETDSHRGGQEGFFSSSPIMFCLFAFLSVASVSFFHSAAPPLFLFSHTHFPLSFAAVVRVLYVHPPIHTLSESFRALD